MVDEATLAGRELDDAPSRLAPLSEQDELEIADGYPEVRGWDVRDYRTARKAAKVGVPTLLGASVVGGVAAGIALRRKK